MGKWRKWAVVGILGVAIAVGVLAGGGMLQAPRPELIVLPGAAEVRRVRFRGTDQVSYSLKERYPAREGLDAISARMAVLGWQPMKDDFLNPGPALLTR